MLEKIAILAVIGAFIIALVYFSIDEAFLSAEKDVEPVIKTEEIDELPKVLEPDVPTIVEYDRFKNLSPEEKGLAIFQEADERDDGFKDFTAAMKMILRNKNNEASSREIRVKTLEVVNDGDKSLTVFDTPKDVKGTGFLSWAHQDEHDDQWLYLPAMKRVKRISSANKSGSFMGSDFAYEDISGYIVEKYNYKWIRDETYENKDCYVVERYPIDKKYSGYIKQIVWLDKKELREWKVDYYDRKNSLLKTLKSSGYRQYLDKHWRADRLFMENHQTGKSTELLWSDYEFKTGLTDKDFTTNSLKRIR
jgi:outer membrane lipoprotein-sorting protein